MFFNVYSMIGRALYTFFQTLIYVVPALLIAISLHEFAHGYMSYLLGDPTPKMDGRLTLNPFRHLDVWGTLCLLVFHVGWAKPIRVNTRNYKNKRRDLILVAAAGPLMNFILAFVFMLLYGLIYKFGTNGVIINYLYVLSYYGVTLNVGLGVFNLIPVPPLDGANILAEIVPAVDRFYTRYRRYGWLVLLALLGTRALYIPMELAMNSIMDFLQNIVWTILRIGISARTGGGTII
ncbi:MAG: site-2 protease family protein [Bariatricus sp.]|nr:site-2 protease family protein [Bariatricus sp.]